MDRRKRKTQQAIKEACLKLLESKNFEMLTVSDITEEADISRGTFYLHYVDKYDMLEQYEQQILEKINAIFMSNLQNVDLLIDLLKTRYMTVLQLFTYFKEEQILIEIIFKINGGVRLQNEFTTIFQDVFSSIPSLKKSVESLNVPVELFIPIISSIIFTVLKQIIVTNSDITAEQMAKTILNILINGPAKALGLIEGEQIDIEKFIENL